MKTPKISVAISTRNRYQGLMHNLGSLLSQDIIPDEIIVVDNNSKDQTKQAVESIAKTSRCLIKYVRENKKGYPFVYNKGLKSATNDWVAFLDDDCVATHDWCQNIIKAIKKFPHTIVLLGKSDPLQINNPLGLTESFIKSLGLYKVNQKKEVLDFEILDSKNIIYNKQFLVKNKIRFDESLVLLGGGSSEDCDLGMQIQRAGGRAIYEPKIEIFHKEIIDFTSYYQKLISRAKDHLVYEKKWQEYRREMGFKKVGFWLVMRSLWFFIKEKKLNFIQAFLVVANVGLSFMIIKIINLFYE